MEQATRARGAARVVDKGFSDTTSKNRTGLDNVLAAFTSAAAAVQIGWLADQSQGAAMAFPESYQFRRALA
nr:hypothetical protein [Nocardia amikacinitolerans]